jgi:DNA-binding sugar fermentation-stimulating protein
MTSHIRLGTPVQVVTGVVIARPSKVIKTPYVCDVSVDDESYQAHTPSLGCNGLVDKGATVIAVKRDTTKGKCGYGVIASLLREPGRTSVVGVDPSLAERFAADILIDGVVPSLKVKPGTKLQSQRTYGDCRFDYCGIADDGRPFICEVKNVSIAEYDDVHPKKRAKYDYSGRDPMTKVALFPSGYKPKGQTHSERALKHTQTLTKIKQENPIMRCIILFVVQRDDADTFQPSNGDIQYRNALRDATSAGVEVYAVRVVWTYDEGATTITPAVHKDRCLLNVCNESE